MTKAPLPEIPETAVGQVWVSPRPRIAPRTIVEAGAIYGTDEPCVWFTVPSQKSHYWLRLKQWRQWARKSEARPVP